MDDVRAVMDAVDSERAALFGYFEGGPMSMLFAATYPERTRSLVLFATYASFWVEGTSEEQLSGMVEGVVSRWGDGTTLDRFAPEADDVMRTWWGSRERLAGSPGVIRHLMAGNFITDVRDALPAIQAPTLVLHRTDDPVLDPAIGRELAELIPSARCMELQGSSTLPWVDADSLLDEIEEFLTGARPGRTADRVLATILFTDLVGSTETARSMGDAAWSRLVEQHHTAVRRELDHYAGEEVDTAGDGFFAVFNGPARAIRCALGIEAAVARLGLRVRAGVHTGEVERPDGGKPRGIAVNVAARVSGLADAGEVLVTATTRDLVAGSGLGFEDRGEHELRGLGESRRVFAASAGQ
jgi:class 3 adenylate cyclase